MAIRGAVRPGDEATRRALTIERLADLPGADWLLALAATLLALIGLVVDPDPRPGSDSPTALAIVIIVLAGASLGFRRSHPVPVLVIAVVARTLVTWSTGADLALMPVAAVALYTVARHGDRRRGLSIASSAAVAMALAMAAMGDDSFPLELLGEAAQGLLPIAIADGLRTRAERVDDLIESEAQARVQAERLRIARDLHDVVAHGLSTIAVQSGVAAHLLSSDGGRHRAQEALEAINTASRTSLEELRSMLGVLRSTDDAELRPVPTDPDDLGRVVAPARANGVDVALETTGAFPPHAGESAVVAVHRIVEEALTNVARHAGAVPAAVRVDHGDDEVAVTIVNGPPSEVRPAVPSTGVGLIGMHERAESVGGSLRSEATSDGGFRVEATIPYQTTVRPPVAPGGER